MSYQLKMNRLEDYDPMPFGMHKGEPMLEVPVNYLNYLWKECDLKWDNSSPVANYIRHSLGALKMEAPDLIW